MEIFPGGDHPVDGGGHLFSGDTFPGWGAGRFDDLYFVEGTGVLPDGTAACETQYYGGADVVGNDPDLSDSSGIAGVVDRESVAGGEPEFAQPDRPGGAGDCFYPGEDGV